MWRGHQVRAVSVCAASLVILVTSSRTVSAQATVAAAGEGTVTLTYQNYYVTGHFDPFGRKNKNGATHTKALLAELDYALTDRIAINVSLPFIASKYTGGSSYVVSGRETFPGPLDDYTYHAAFQDVRVEVRRTFEAGRVTITPFVGASLPTHAYQTIGEAVPGRRRRELQFGASGATSLQPMVPGVYVHGRYAYAAAQRISGFPATRSMLDVEVERAAGSRVSLRGLASWQFRHSGPKPPELQDIWVEHDRFIVSSFFNLGGGLSISLSRSTELYGLWIATVSGKDGAHVSRTLAIGISRGFGGGLGGLAAAAKAATDRRP
ncbi:MAG: hypothetical protein WBC51_13720 [Vicinamibacterales bacterium]